ncbi:stromal interaction molecule homolog isoform X1 [Halyomorpha halys]|uniref:stromal interaction molecule homolog isoform X1 n=1 Tax=Halyomorpha halys TaxID=286706 RepID=UPI0034D1CB5E
MNVIFKLLSVFSLFVLYSSSGESSFNENQHKNDISQSSSDENAPKHPITEVSSGSKINSDFCSDDLSCSIIAPNDKHGLEAIRSLHRQLDDDANGAVDLSESDDFLREELQYESGAERRQKAFHRNDDMHVSVKELWEAWVRSEVHNWTIEQTVEWLALGVGLPQYSHIFAANGVDGATLPRLAVNNMQYLSNVLGIKDPIHKQKIALKAMDVVLFGPPKESNNHVKDIVLVTLLMAALIGFWYTYRMNKISKKHLKRMMKEMESLQKAELTLEDLQKELERARQEQECATTEKQDLERKLMEHGDSAEVRSSCSDLELARLKAENERLRNELERAEVELKDRCPMPPPGLQQWLQLTYELENKTYFKKKMSAEKQLQTAREAERMDEDWRVEMGRHFQREVAHMMKDLLKKEVLWEVIYKSFGWDLVFNEWMDEQRVRRYRIECEKLRRKRSSLVGAFVSTHGKSIDEVDRSIVDARTSLNEVTQELAERVHRWKKIERICGFNIVNNRGLTVLESELYKGSTNGRSLGLKGRLNSQDGLDDDTNSITDRGGGGDSSSSEKLEDDDNSSLNIPSSEPVEFIVGGDNEEVTPKGKRLSKHFDWEKSSISHSQSQEFSSELEGLGNAKLSHSDSNLESPVLPIIHPQHRRLATNRSDILTSGASLEEEAYSTDSNSTAAEDVISLDRSLRKNKLRFPKFSRKSRYTPPPEKYT